MAAAGLPSRVGHSTGFKGYIGGTLYAQQPSGLVSAYSDKSFLVRNNHGRLFGPAAAQGGGYVYSGAFSIEDFVMRYLVLPSHTYVSSNPARDALAAGFVASGQTQLPSIDLQNAYNTADTTTGDHDGKAALIVLK